MNTDNTVKGKDITIFTQEGCGPELLPEVSHQPLSGKCHANRHLGGWDSLSDVVIASDSVNCFTNKLDMH